MQQPRELGKNAFLDYSILVPYLVLSVFGLIMVFSSTVPAQLINQQNVYKPLISQSIFLVVSLVFMFIIYRLRISTFKSSTFLGIFVPVEIILLIIGRVAPAANGAHGWIPIPGVGTIQPAEFLKVFVIWYLALILANRQKKIANLDYRGVFEHKKWYDNAFSARWFFLILMMGIVIIMPDLGNFVIILVIAVTMIFSSGISYHWGAGYFKVFLVAAAVFIGWIFLTAGQIIPGVKVYFFNRFKAFADPFNGLFDWGRQLANSYYAISNGGWFGRGLGNSIEKKGYLSEATTDFIFPVVVEELGVIGAVLILSVLFFLILRILLVGIRARDPFNAMIAIGTGTMLLVQVFVNVGGAIGLIPETGVTFPFISQGGSSLLILSIAIALVLNVAAKERRDEIIALSLAHDNEAHQARIRARQGGANA